MNLRLISIRQLLAYSLLCACTLFMGCWGESPAPAPSVGKIDTPAEKPRVPSIPTSANISPIEGAEELTANPLLAEEIRQTDPTTAGWESEAFHDVENAQLNKLGKLISEKKLSSEELAAVAVSEIKLNSLRPDELTTVFSDSTVIVRRAEYDAVTANGLAAFSQALKKLVEISPQAHQRRVAFKGLRVELAETSAQTTADFQFTAEDDSGISQVNAVWEMGWTRENPPRITFIEMSQYEEVIPGNAGRLEFKDIAPAVLAGSQSYRQQLAYGYDYWRARSDRALGSDLAGNQGIALGDVNDDGLDDVYIMQPGGLPNRLYLHQPDGTASDISASSKVDYLDFSRAALFLDIDNDGDQDLVLGMNPGLLLLENNGKGIFSERAALRCPGSVYSLAAADYDNDGDLDLYACGRYPQGALSEETRVQGLPVPYHDANNGGPSSLWENEGQWRFENVTQAVGLDAENRRFTLAASWEDYDNDGDQDLYVANDFGRNNLYRNDDGKFTNVAFAEGVEDIGAGMSASWGDVNNDGRMDLYVGNMFSSAGHRVAFQDQFMPDVDAQTRSQFQRHARGNSLFINQGEKQGPDFDDVSLAAGVNLGRWAWGSMFVDLNGDGWEDLFVANGFITTEDTGDL